MHTFVLLVLLELFVALVGCFPSLYGSGGKNFLVTFCWQL